MDTKVPCSSEWSRWWGVKLTEPGPDGGVEKGIRSRATVRLSPVANAVALGIRYPGADDMAREQDVGK